MTLDEWLAPAIELKITEMIDVCDEKNEYAYEELDTYLDEIKNKSRCVLEVSKDIKKLIIKKTRQDIETVYPAALHEGIRLGKEMK